MLVKNNKINNIRYDYREKLLLMIKNLQTNLPVKFIGKVNLQLVQT